MIFFINNFYVFLDKKQVLILNIVYGNRLAADDIGDDCRTGATIEIDAGSIVIRKREKP